MVAPFHICVSSTAPPALPANLLQDVSARLAAGLSAIELYAVRYLEDIAPVDVEAVAAAAIATIQQEEWDVAAIEKRKEQQEAEAEDSEEAIEGWDKAAADAAYQRYQEQVAAEVAAAEAAAAAAAELTPDFTPGTSYAWGGEGGEY
jgi:hypothetical protein